MNWSSSKDLELDQGQASIWKFSVDEFEPYIEKAFAILSQEEIARLKKYRFKKDYHTGLLARTVLRILLGQYSNMSPNEIVFEYNEQGKPAVTSDQNMEFNISHSGRIVIIGFCIGHSIGVDVEWNEREVEIGTIARSFFSNKEYEKLLAVPRGEMLSSFYNCWTRKEAFIKAKGGGLSIPLDQFEVSLQVDETPKLINIGWDPNDVLNWSVESFHVGTPYTGAVMVNSPTVNFKYLDGDKHFDSLYS